MAGKHSAEHHEIDPDRDGGAHAAGREDHEVHRDGRDTRGEARDAYGADHGRTPDEPTAGGRIISGEGEEVPDQTEGGLIISGHGDEVPNQTAGGLIIEGKGHLVSDRNADTVVADDVIEEDKRRMAEGREANDFGRTVDTDESRAAEDARTARTARVAGDAAREGDVTDERRASGEHDEFRRAGDDRR